MSSVLIKNAFVLTMTEEKLSLGDILINDDKIVAIGKVDNALLSGEEVVIDATNKVAMPGMVNAHTHAAMTLLRSFAEGMELMSWLNDAIWPAEAKMNKEHIYWGTMLAIVEMLKSGTTTFADMYGPFMEEVARAVKETGIRANLCRGCVGVADSEMVKIKENEELFVNYNNTADGRIKVWFGPHATYTCSEDYLKEVVSLAKKYNTGIHIHIAETMAEDEQIREMYKKSPVEYLNDCGVFDVPTIAAHSVWLSDSEIELFAQKNVGVAHNPASNMKLASGCAPIEKMRKMGVTVGIGTDGASSNNSLNMFKDTMLASFMQKLTTKDANALPAYDALKMATLGSAKALRWDDEIGSLEVGKKADIILVDVNKPHFCPWNNTISDLVNSAESSDVTESIVNGKLLMQNRKLLYIDEEMVMLKAKELVKSLR